MVLTALRKTENLLPAGPVNLLLAEFGFRRSHSAGFSLHQLVNHAQGGNVARGDKVRTDAKGVNRRAPGHQLLDLVFVQIAAGYDLGIVPAVAIQDLAHVRGSSPAGRRCPAALQELAFPAWPRFPRPPADRRCPPEGWQCPGKFPARLQSCGARWGKPASMSAPPCRPGADRKARRPARWRWRRSPPRTPPAPLERPASGPCARRVPNSRTLTAPRRDHHSRRLRGHQRLIVDHGKQIGFNNLRFHYRTRHLHQRLIREYQSALRHGADISVKPEFPQVLKKFRRHRVEGRQLAQKATSSSVKCRFSKIGQRRVKPRRHQVGALRRQVAHEEFERSVAVDAMLEIRRRHRQLVEVYQQRLIGVHVSLAAPRRRRPVRCTAQMPETVRVTAGVAKPVCRPRSNRVKDGGGFTVLCCENRSPPQMRRGVRRRFLRPFCRPGKDQGPPLTRLLRAAMI